MAETYRKMGKKLFSFKNSKNWRLSFHLSRRIFTWKP
jgi:hypothetical protein